ncbi:tail fiber assembly protein [Pantoea sp.]|uniref:tail fiber assembly protein n=1 Tax=Pantoea sp. TaxID=69393 RepID=UPI00289D7AB2|nr:tail fiber assembly protein [Pantoea sp.]
MAENYITLDKNGLAKASGFLTVYNYESATGIFTGPTDEYLMQGVGIPASACCDAPPEADPGSVAVFSNGNWQVLPDHRGKMAYAVTDGSPVEITAPGDWPENTTPLKPATAFDEWDGEKWVTNTDAEKAAAVADADSQKVSFISQANSMTQAWQTQLLLGIITDTDKASLLAWMTYIQAVQAVDTSVAPEINWPEQPAI